MHNATEGFGVFIYIVGRIDASLGHGPIFAAATNNAIIILMLFFTGCMAYGSATAFHQSVHHSPAGQLSLLLGIRGPVLTVAKGGMREGAAIALRDQALAAA